MAKPKQTPTKLTITLLQEAGYHVELVERRHAFNPVVTVDLMNFADLLCFRPDRPILLVQATDGGTGGNHAKRRKKVLGEPRAKLWIEAGGAISIISWRQPVRDGLTQDKWVGRIDELTLSDFDTRGE